MAKGIKIELTIKEAELLSEICKFYESCSYPESGEKGTVEKMVCEADEFSLHIAKMLDTNIEIAKM